KRSESGSAQRGEAFFRDFDPVQPFTDRLEMLRTHVEGQRGVWFMKAFEQKGCEVRLAEKKVLRGAPKQASKARFAFPRGGQVCAAGLADDPCPEPSLRQKPHSAMPHRIIKTCVPDFGLVRQRGRVEKPI